MKALRELVMKWELTANSKPATEGGDYAANAMTDCARELEAALDACPTLPELVKELRDRAKHLINRAKTSRGLGYLEEAALFNQAEGIKYAADRIEAALNTPTKPLEESASAHCSNNRNKDDE
jgi:hypothetical protein